MSLPTRLLVENPVVRRVWLGAMVSSLGDALTWMALTWYLVERTGSGSSVGTLLLCFAVPSALTGALIGRLLDHYDPRRLMIADNVLRASLIVLVPILDGLGVLALWQLYLIAALSGALAPATQVGVRLVVPRLVETDRQPEVNALLSLCEQGATVLGPAVAGACIAHWGASRALYLDGASFLLMAFALIALPKTPARPADPDLPPSKPWTELKRPAILATTLLSALFYFSYGPTEAAMPIFVHDRLSNDARALGAIWSAVGVGSLVGSMATGWLARNGATGLWLALIMVLWGGFQCLFSQSKSTPFAVLCFLCGGIAWGPYVALKTTLVQRLVDERRLGATLGLQAAVLAPMASLGTALGGWLLTHFSPTNVIFGSGLACIFGGVFAVFIPALRLKQK